MIDERLVRLRTELPEHDPTAPDVSAHLAQFRQNGEQFKSELLLVVHGDVPASRVDQKVMKQWIKLANRFLAGASVDRAHRTQWLGEMALASGMTPQQFAQEAIDQGARELEQWAADHGMTTAEAMAAIDQMPTDERPLFGDIARALAARELAERGTTN